MEQYKQKYKYMVATRCFTYNHAPYIKDAMNGFTMQKTSFPVVTLIVDDASADGEPEVIKQYLDRHFYAPYRTEETEYAQIICAKHKTNENCEFVVFFLKYNHYRVKKSKHPYLSEWLADAKYHALCEGDDYWIAPDKLQKQVLFLEQNPDYVLSHTSYKAYFDKNKHFSVSKDIENNRSIHYPTEVFRSYRILTLTVVVRSSTYYEIKASDPYLFGGAFMMGDGQLWYEMARRGKLHFIPVVMCVYRVHEGSASRQPIKGAYRFALSCAEMQLYVARRDDVQERDYFEEKYKQSLYKYLLFDPNYKVMFKSDEIERRIQTAPSWRLFGEKMILVCKFHLSKTSGKVLKYLIKTY